MMSASAGLVSLVSSAGSTSARELPMVTAIKGILAKRPVRGRDLGDSITAGGSSGGQPVGGLGGLLAYVTEGQLMNYYYPTDTSKTQVMEGYGVSGLTVNGLMNAAYRFDSMLGQADLVKISLGANDMSASGSQLSASNMAKLGRNYFDLVQQCLDADKSVIATKIYKTDSKDATDVATFNAMIEAGCAARGIPFWTGMYDAMQGFTATRTYDGTHPNALGTEMIAANWKSWWRSMFGQAQLGSWVSSSTSPQTAVVGNALGKAAAFGDYGYGSPAGVHTTAAWPVAGNMKEAGWHWTKTAGESVMCQLFSLGSVTVGQYYRFSQRIKTANLRASGGYLQNELVINGAGVVRTLYTGQADLTEECVIDYVFKAPAAATNVDIRTILRSVAGAGANTANELWVADQSLRNLTTSGLAAEWGLS